MIHKTHDEIYADEGRKHLTPMAIWAIIGFVGLMFIGAAIFFIIFIYGQYAGSPAYQL